MRYLSPLRYPGGKAKLSPYLERIIRGQSPSPQYYAEPFAGGAGAALRLLVDGVISEVFLNDLNPGIAAFWRSILSQPDDFCRLVHNADLSIEEWKHQRSIYLTPLEHDDLELGFATFFLNRVNRSGILGARPIGGLEQSGKWKIDARFNKPRLIERIKFVSKWSSQIHVSEMEGIQFLQEIHHLGNELFVYADPPYIVQGEGLYLHAFNEEDHLVLANYLSNTSCPWLLTYDDDPRITDVLYANSRCAIFEISHTAHQQHVGKEAVIYSSNLNVIDLELTNGRTAQWIK